MLHLLTVILPLLSLANERIDTPENFAREGYRAVTHSRANARTNTNAIEGPALPAPHSLAWPVEFEDASHQIGNSMAQYQPFGDPYFHGGCDLRTRALATIRTPVAGKIEAGHYGYTTNPDGSLEKQWLPWPARGDATYFEVAVISPDGIRYEFHHVDRNTLPASLVKMLNEGGGTVTEGTELGKVIRWPGFNGYHHVHYNVILPDGTRVNPERLSPLLKDTQAPQVLAAMALMPNGQVVDAIGALHARPLEFVVAVEERKDGSAYVNPPVLARLVFANGAETRRDFRETLTGPTGQFPPLWDVFRASLRGPNGRQWRTEGGYGEGTSLIRLVPPVGASGPYVIYLGDMAGNLAEVRGEIGTLKAIP